MSDIPKVRKYYPVPMTNPLFNNPSIFQYQDVNKDKSLRKNITSFFNDQTINWIKNDDSFNKFQSKLNFMKSSLGYDFIYKLLRKFVHHSDIKWYDLRDNYDSVKKYIKHKMNKMI